jgi:hypothetical protein
MVKEELSQTKNNTVKQEFHRRELDEHKATTRGILGDQPTIAGNQSR